MALNVSEVKDKGTQLLARLTHLTMRKKIVVGSVTAAIILGAGGAVFLAAQPEAILVSGSAITNLPALLKEAEAQHAAANPGLETLSNAGKDKGTDCFVQMVDKTTTELLSCGAILHASQQVSTYDAISVSWDEQKDGTYKGTLHGSFQNYAGNLVAENSELRRPDGKKPVSVDDLKAKSATQVLTDEHKPAGGDFGILEGLTAKAANLGDPVKLSTPGAVQDVSVGATETVTDSSGEEFAPPVGSQFVTFQISNQQGKNSADTYSEATAAAKTAQKTWSDFHNTLSYSDAYFGGESRNTWDAEDDRLKALSDAASDSVTKAQAALIHYNVDVYDSISNERISGEQIDVDGVVSSDVITVLVAPGTVARLVVSGGGATQTISLSPGVTNEVTSDNVNTLVQFAKESMVDFPNGTVVRTDSSSEGSIDASVSSARLSVVNEGVYAAEGESFVTVSTDVKGICANTAQDIVVKNYEQTELSTADGISLGAPLEVQDATSDAKTLVWSVPSDSTEFGLSLRPTALCQGRYMMSTQTFDYEWAAPESDVGTVEIVFTQPESDETEDDTKADDSEATSSTK